MELTLTQRAKAIINGNDEEIRIAKNDFRRGLIYSEFWDQITDYIENKSHFNSQEDEIKRNIDIITNRNNNNYYDYKDYLESGFLNPSMEAKERNNTKKNLSEWLEGVQIRSREDALRMCFALNKTPETANDFLFKGCCRDGLNVRNAKDAAVFFCLLQNQDSGKRKYTFEDAERLYSAYLQTRAASTDQFQRNPNSRNDTTRRLIGALLDKNCVNSEEDFLKFLEENSSSFIGFSKSAFYEFNRVKLDLIGRILKDEIDTVYKDEIPGVEQSPGKYQILLSKFCSYIGTEEAEELKKSLSDLANFKKKKGNAGEKEEKAKERRLLSKAKERIHIILGEENFDDIYERVKGRCLKDEHEAKKFYDCISISGFWAYLLPKTFVRSHEVSSFDAKIITNLSKFRKNNFATDLFGYSDETNDTDVDVVRKQIILMKCFELILRKENDPQNMDYYSGIVDLILIKCGFYPLYPRHYFDFIILITFRILTEIGYKEALVFLREIICKGNDDGAV